MENFTLASDRLDFDSHADRNAFGRLRGVYFAIAAIFGGSMRVQQESLLLILAIAVRTQAPLSEEIDLLADSSRGRFRRRLRKLAVKLRSGTRLSEALEDLPG